ncbi:MAG: hypothetical protein KAS70_02790 [Planctomycetes bacterium]|nr:hypothetical protein [Planctomycetota bacterium]
MRDKIIVFCLLIVVFILTPIVCVKTEDEPVKTPVDKNVITLDQGEKVYLKEKRIEISGMITNPTWPLELLACAEGGKDYESLVVMECKPQNIHLALVMFGLKEGVGPTYFGDPVKPTGDLVLVFLEWEKDGQTISARTEDLILDARTKETVDRVGWSFTGSDFVDELDPDTGKPTGRKIYLANSTKTIIATYHDPSAILDNPTRGGGIGNIYYPHKDKLPPKGTPVKIVIRVPTAKELKELKKINAEVDKREQAELKRWKEAEESE